MNLRTSTARSLTAVGLSTALCLSLQPAMAATSSADVASSEIRATQLAKAKTHVLYFRETPRGHQANGGARLKVRGNKVAGSFCYVRSECVSIKGWGRVSKGKLRFKAYNYANQIFSQSMKASGKGKKFKLKGWKRVSKARYNKIFAW